MYIIIIEHYYLNTVFLKCLSQDLKMEELYTEIYKIFRKYINKNAKLRDLRCNRMTSKVPSILRV